MASTTPTYWKHRARIISPTLLAEYAYVLRVGGIVYTVTYVEDLSRWMVKHLEEFPLFERASEESLREQGKGDVIDAVLNGTGEGKKVERNGGTKYFAAFMRIEDKGLGSPGVAQPQGKPWLARASGAK